MPELPEVETVAKQLRSKLNGKTIVKLKIIDQRMIDSSILKELPVKITNVTRRGKSLIFHLSNDKFLFVHLRMTGHFSFAKEKLPPYTVAVFHLDDKQILTHNSIRRFGGIDLLNKRQLEEKLAKVGPEPFDITAEQFSDLIKRYPNANLKTKLMDQSFLAGVGNIYAQEAMYRAGINPLKLVKEVKEFTKLHQELCNILQLSIENNGTTIQNFSHIDGKGEFQHLLTVYGKDKCPQGHPTQKIKIAGRGTWYCDSCQW